jgi:hypothetical protein
MKGEKIGLTPGCRAFQLKQCPAYLNRIRRLATWLGQEEQ